MPKWRTALLALAITLCFFVGASAAVGDVSYGSWSEWTDQPIENQNNLFVETREVFEPVTRRAWRYTRYTVKDESGIKHVAFASEAPGARLEVMELDAPLKSVGTLNGHTAYKGEWFNQQTLIIADHLKAATQYRAREIFTVTCALEPSSLLMEVGDHRKIGIQILDPNAYSLTSDNPDVAAVDQEGLVSAIAPGRTLITLIYEGQNTTCEVLVNSGQAEIAKGYAALRLSGTRLTVGYKPGKKQVTGLALSLEPDGAKVDPGKRFLVDDVDGGLFSLRALCPRIAYLTAPLNDEGAIEAGAAAASMLKEIFDREREIKFAKEAARAKENAAQTAVPTPEAEDEYGEFLDGVSASHRFRAVQTPEGDLILCLQADPAYALTAAASSEGSGLVIEKLSLSDARQRWTLTPEKSNVGQDRIWRLPVADNSFNQITDDYKTMARDGDKHDGIDFSPTGNQDAVAVASGRVVRVDDRCTHDYRKTKLNKYGRYIDPCDEADGIVSKYGSYGKYVIIEHEDGTRSMYAHLAKILVRSGQKVKEGQVVGKMGSTGSSNGTHLHFEVRISSRAVDPRYFLELPKIGQYVP